MKIPVICTTLLIEKSPQALPLGAACVASAIKNYKPTGDICDVKLFAFCREDTSFAPYLNSVESAGGYIAQELDKMTGGSKQAVFCFSV